MKITLGKLLASVMIFIQWNYYILSLDLISKYFWKCRRQAAIIIFSCWRNHTYISNKVVYLYKSQAHNIACMQGKKATLRWKVVFMVPYFKGRKLIVHTYIYMCTTFLVCHYYVAHLSKEKSSSFSLQKKSRKNVFCQIEVSEWKVRSK